MPGLFDGFITPTELAEERGWSLRKVQRLMAEPDGLPYAQVGGERLIPIEGARSWLMRRIRRPNPKRGKTRSDAA